MSTEQASPEFIKRNLARFPYCPRFLLNSLSSPNQLCNLALKTFGVCREICNYHIIFVIPDIMFTSAWFLFPDVPVPCACFILVGLFMLQHCGTHKIGFIFAPIIAVWLLFVGGVGLYNIFHWNKEIIYKISPVYMFKFIRNHDLKSWRLLGSIILCVAGQCLDHRIIQTSLID